MKFWKSELLPSPDAKNEGTERGGIQMRIKNFLQKVEEVQIWSEIAHKWADRKERGGGTWLNGYAYQALKRKNLKKRHYPYH